MQHYDERQRDGKRDRVQQSVGQADGFHRHLEEVRNGGLGDLTEEDRADRDAQLSAGELERKSLVRVLNLPRASVAATSSFVDGAAFERGQ